MRRVGGDVRSGPIRVEEESCACELVGDIGPSVVIGTRAPQ